MVDNPPNYRGRHLPQRFIVRYEHEDHTVLVDFLGGPLISPGEPVYRHIRRVADSYQFFTLGNAQGRIASAEFLLSESFFEEQRPPASLRSDVAWLSREMDADGLSSVDVWWTACMGHAYGVAAEPDGEPGPEEED